MSAFKMVLPALVMIVAHAIFAQAGSADSNTESDALKVLYVTSVGWFHDYQRQTELVTTAIGERIDVDFDVIVGDTARLRDTDFALGYDVLIYNFAMPPDVIHNW